MLMHIVAAKEQSLGYLALCAEGKHLAAGIHQFVGIVRQQVEVQPVLRKLGNVEVPPAGPDGDVARGQLRSRQSLRINVHWQA